MQDELGVVQIFSKNNYDDNQNGTIILEICLGLSQNQVHLARSTYLQEGFAICLLNLLKQVCCLRPASVSSFQPYRYIFVPCLKVMAIY